MEATALRDEQSDDPKLGNQLMAHTPRVLSLSEVGEASAELVSDDFPVLHVARPSRAKSIYEQ